MTASAFSRPLVSLRATCPTPDCSLGVALRASDEDALHIACVAALGEAGARRNLLRALTATQDAPGVALARDLAAEVALPAALLAACSDAPARERVEAVRLLGVLAPQSAPAKLAPILRDPDAEVREAAVGTLVACASLDAARVLVGALVAGALRPDEVGDRLGAPWAGAILVAALSHRAAVAGLHANGQAGAARAALCAALRASGHPRRIEVLGMILRDGDGLERPAAARELGLLRSGAATPALLAALDDDAPGVRAAAARALGEVGAVTASDRLVAKVDERDARVAKAARRALLALGEPGREALAGGGREALARQRARWERRPVGTSLAERSRGDPVAARSSLAGLRAARPLVAFAAA